MLNWPIVVQLSGAFLLVSVSYGYTTGAERADVGLITLITSIFLTWLILTGSESLKFIPSVTDHVHTVKVTHSLCRFIITSTANFDFPITIYGAKYFIYTVFWK